MTLTDVNHPDHLISNLGLLKFFWNNLAESAITAAGRGVFQIYIDP